MRANETKNNVTNDAVVQNNRSNTRPGVVVREKRDDKVERVYGIDDVTAIVNVSICYEDDKGEEILVSTNDTGTILSVEEIYTCLQGNDTNECTFRLTVDGRTIFASFQGNNPLKCNVSIPRQGVFQASFEELLNKAIEQKHLTNEDQDIERGNVPQQKVQGNIQPQQQVECVVGKDGGRPAVNNLPVVVPQLGDHPDVGYSNSKLKLACTAAIVGLGVVAIGVTLFIGIEKCAQAISGLLGRGSDVLGRN